MSKTATHPRSASLQAACSMALDIAAGHDAPTRIKLLPAGSFSAHDGRPAGLEDVTCAAWVLTDAVGTALVQAARQRQREFVIDYEHSTLKSKDSGQPAPAAGWFSALEYVPDDGLYATDVRWTDKAAAMLRAGEYRYRSPVFSFNKHTGLVDGFHSLALTNDPGLDVLPALAQLSAVGGLLLADPISTTTPQEPHHMDKLAILAALGLPASTTDDTALTALAALRGQVAAKDQEIAALQAKQFDPARHIPLAEHQKVADQLAQLSTQAEKAEHDKLMAAALTGRTILPANEAYWREQPLAALQAFLKDAKPLLDMGMQTAGKPPADDSGTVALSADEKAVCDLLGITAAEFLKSKAA